MANRSVKELFDEITSLDRIDWARLLSWYEWKLGIPEERSVRPRAVLDDRVFVAGYDIILMEWNGTVEKIQAVRLLRRLFCFSLIEITAFLKELPKTVYELHPKDDALELRREFMEAGFTVKLEWRMGYILYSEYTDYDGHQRDQLTSLSSEPDL